MPGPPTRHGTGDSSVLDDVIVWALAYAAAAAVTAWAGAQLAVVVSRQRALPVGLGSAVHAVLALPGAISDPAAAWPAEVRNLIPGPLLYWACTVAVAVAVMAAAVVVHRLVAGPGPGTDRRRRLGVETGARLARGRDLAPLVVPGPQPGRLILGRVDGALVATENCSSASARTRRRRRGDRSAVAVIGPSRCGKTANMVSGILDWQGPAILSSVKDDLLAPTLARRSQLGEVKVFDPTATTGQDSASWSPLRDAATPTGAHKAARSLLAAYSRPGRGREDVEFFGDLGTAFLAALFYLAASSGKTMADVVTWVLTRDRPRGRRPGEVGDLIDQQLASKDDLRRQWAGRARQGLQGVWNNDERTMSSIYITAQRMLGIWQDPQVAAACQDCDIDLDWLVSSGPNTLYICGDRGEQDRLAVLFGGVLSDLIEQQAYEWVSKNGEPLPDLLVVLDEAANTPTRWLPSVASTCSGLGMVLVTIWQSKAQIDAAYGILADSVLTNHGTKVFFSGTSDLATLTYASRLVGEEEVAQHSVSTDLGGGRHSRSDSTTRVPLVPTDVLRQAPLDQALLVHGTLPPAHLHARPYYGERRLRRLAAEGRGRLERRREPSAPGRDAEAVRVGPTDHAEEERSASSSSPGQAGDDLEA
jgi:type IV secretion system protein VirD4